MPENPLEKLRLFKFSSGRPKPRIPFTTKDLQLIFSPANDKHLNEPHKFWVPRIAYYQGMRINEISQLYVDDIRAEGKVMGINVSSDRPGQKLKNSNSKRFLPLHPALVKLGFLKYLKEVKATGSAHLFPGLKWGDNGPGHQVSAWFNRTYLRSICAIKEKRQTFHSFRHTFATFGVRSWLPDSCISIMLGHLPGVSQLRRCYAHDATPSEQAEDLAKIKFPELTMSKYKSGQFRTYLTMARAVETREERSSK
ncbi:MAG TPA: site-specific integrase [Dyella sp.]|uniref:site-specific integrase n=1 Tax=Dyella sp. TaxID=1869338 RepID=UPI002B5E7AC8|nr:site-specific integrase [Dyella sp.]HTV86967.1 site-specific integrase [Dyella sp.]